MADDTSGGSGNEIVVDQERTNAVKPATINLDLPFDEKTLVKEPSNIVNENKAAESGEEEKPSNETDLPEDKLPSSDSDLLPMDENDLDEYDPDLYITDEEKQAFEYMLTQKRDEIVERKEKFEKWVDGITRRRMFALSRIRKINQKYGIRKSFFGEVETFIRDVHTVLGPGGKDPDSMDSLGAHPPSTATSESINGLEFRKQTVLSKIPNAQDGFNREDTGFVPRDNDSNPTDPSKLPIIVPVKS
ncbi:hypothetical protein FSP39_013505 [Pinctada imbricata]|uniref:Uncharacterized protein n=1 Tax=Pinctada imbricata TaxID=66713 RepID=A0AA88YCY2_PINIB|nr:hypothetical protein FSP39_013505 [Pinctada imbricata]